MALVNLPTFLVISPIERIGTVGGTGCSWIYFPEVFYSSVRTALELFSSGW